MITSRMVIKGLWLLSTIIVIFCKDEDKLYLDQSIIIPTIGIGAEEQGKVFLHKGYSYHDVIITLPATIKDVPLSDQCNNNELFSAKTALNYLNKAYIAQLKILTEEIPESNIFQSIDCPKTTCYSVNNHENLKQKINIVQEKRILETMPKVPTPCTKDLREIDKDPLIPICSDFSKDVKYLQPYEHNNLFADIPDLDVVTHNRTKRFAPLVIAGVGAAAAFIAGGLVTSLINSGRIHEIVSHMELVDSKLNEISIKLDDISEDVYNAGVLIDNITTVMIPNLIKNINDIALTVDCAQRNSMVFSVSAASWLANIPNKIMRIINSAYLGRVSPDIVSKRTLSDLINNRLDLKDSIYAQNLDLIYEVGSIVILRVAHLPFTMQLMLMIPVITSDIPNQLYSIYPVNFLDQNMNLILKTSNEVAYDPFEKVFWDVRKEHCVSGSRYVVCPYEHIHLYYDTCLTELLIKTRSKLCGTQRLRNETVMIQTLHNGLLVGSTNHTYTITKMRGSGIPSVVRSQFSNKPTFVSRSQGNYLEIDEHIYTLQDSRTVAELGEDPISLDINHTFIPPASNIDYHPLNIPDRDKIQPITPFGQESNTIIILLVCSITSTIIIFMLCIFYRRILKRRFSNQNTLRAICASPEEIPNDSKQFIIRIPDNMIIH